MEDSRKAHNSCLPYLVSPKQSEDRKKTSPRHKNNTEMLNDQLCILETGATLPDGCLHRTRCPKDSVPRAVRYSDFLTRSCFDLKDILQNFKSLIKITDTPE